VNVESLQCSVHSDYRNRCREINVFEHLNVRQKYVRVSEHKNYNHVHCGISLQLFTVVTKLLVSLI
jgi:hypothetical protein